MRLLYVLLLLDVHTEELPVITPSTEETKSVWSNDTDLRLDQQKKEKTRNATVLVVLPTVVGLFILILTAILLIKWKKCRNESARLLSVNHPESNKPENV